MLGFPPNNRHAWRSFPEPAATRRSSSSGPPKDRRDLDCCTAQSDDGGKTFGRAAAVPGSSAQGNRGWESTAIDGSGRVFAAWLDHRALVAGNASAAPMTHHEGQAHTSGETSSSVARAQLSKLYVAPLDGSEADARVVAAGVCYCCKTAFTSGPDGALYAAWRHVYPGNIRDIAFSLSRDGGRTFAPPVRVSEDRWVLDGCPENGPAVAVDGRNRIHVVWPTLVQGSGPTRNRRSRFSTRRPRTGAGSRRASAFRATAPFAIRRLPRLLTVPLRSPGRDRERRASGRARAGDGQLGWVRPGSTALHRPTAVVAPSRTWQPAIACCDLVRQSGHACCHPDRNLHK